MTDKKLLIIVPTRSRPENVAKVVQAWEDTGAFTDGAELCFAVDRDDPTFPDYQTELMHIAKKRGPFTWQTRTDIRWAVQEHWMPMVHKLNRVAVEHTDSMIDEWFAIGFAGDDHLPRTPGWAARYINALAEMSTGIASCPDGYRPDELPTQWAMTADIVRALGRMVPADVEHLYCDNAVWDLGMAAGCYRYLPDALIEHIHPAAKKTGWDAQYKRVNHGSQYVKDQAAYRSWIDMPAGLGADKLAVRKLIEERRA